MKLRAFLLISFCLAAPVMAADIPEVTLDEALEAAIQNSTDIEAARIQLNQAIRNQNAVMTTFMPDISANAGLSTGAVFPGVDGTAYGMTETLDSTAFSGLTVTAGASASFSFTGSMITDKETRNLEKEAASMEYQSAEKALRQTVVEAYWNIAAADISIENAHLAYEDAVRQYESAEEMYINGLADELSLMQSEMAMRQAELSVKVLEDSKELLVSAFRNITGIEGEFTVSELPAPVFLSLPEAAELSEEYSASTLSIRTAENMLAAARNGVETAKFSVYVPVLTASVGYSYSGSGYSSYKGVQSGYSNTGNGLTGSVSLSIPISSMLPGSSGDMAIKDAEDAVKLSAVSLQSAHDNLDETIREKSISIEQNQENLILQEEAVTTAERTYELAEDAYSAGLLSADDLSSARINLFSERVLRCFRLLPSHSQEAFSQERSLLFFFHLFSIQFSMRDVKRSLMTLIRLQTS